jgi:hypothetical protein
MAPHSCTLSPVRRQTRSEADRCRGTRRHLVREVEVFEPPRRLNAPLREQPRRRLVGSAVVEDRVEHLHLPPPQLSRWRACLCPPKVRTRTIRPSIGRHGHRRFGMQQPSPLAAWAGRCRQARQPRGDPVVVGGDHAEWCTVLERARL